MTTPCRGCPDRTAECHGKCEKYNKFRTERNAEREKRFRENSAKQYMSKTNVGCPEEKTAEWLEVKMDVRLHTCVVICRGKRYLAGMDMFGNLHWSAYIYDAWRTRDLQIAEKIAGRTGGDMMLFNPVVGENRKLEVVS